MNKFILVLYIIFLIILFFNFSTNYIKFYFTYNFEGIIKIINFINIYSLILNKYFFILHALYIKIKFIFFIVLLYYDTNTKLKFFRLGGMIIKIGICIRLREMK